MKSRIGQGALAAVAAALLAGCSHSQSPDNGGLTGTQFTETPAAATQPVAMPPAVAPAQTSVVFAPPTAPQVVSDGGAVLRRAWPASVCLMPNGSVKAGPTYYPYPEQANLPGWLEGALSPLVFLGQTALAPVSMILQPPWKQPVYRGSAEPDPALQPTYFPWWGQGYVSPDPPPEQLPPPVDLPPREQFEEAAMQRAQQKPEALARRAKRADP